MEFINPLTLNDPSGYGYSQLVVVPPNSRLVFVAGQGAGKVDGISYAEDFAEQVEQAFENLRAALSAIGASPEDVVKITILSVDHSDEKLQIISQARRRFWPNGKPTSTLIPVPRLASAGMLFEIDAIAMIPDSE